MKGDKKTVGGVVRFIVMRSVGESAVEGVPEEVVFDTMHECGWR